MQPAASTGNFVGRLTENSNRTPWVEWVEAKEAEEKAKDSGEGGGLTPVLGTHNKEGVMAAQCISRACHLPH